MPTYEKIDKKAHYCCTCDFWAGEREVDPSHNLVVYNTFQREMCRGGGKNGEKTTPLARCNYWRMWKKARKAKVSQLLEEEQQRETTNLLDQLEQLNELKKL